MVSTNILRNCDCIKSGVSIILPNKPSKRNYKKVASTSAYVTHNTNSPNGGFSEYLLTTSEFRERSTLSVTMNISHEKICSLTSRQPYTLYTTGSH
jgi:hypothetical protein